MCISLIHTCISKYILLALIMTSQYVCAVLVLCQCAPVSTHTGLLHNQSGDTHAVAEVTCADEVNLDAVLSLLVHIKQYNLLQLAQKAGRYLVSSSGLIER